jgi:glutamate racemase
LRPLITQIVGPEVQLIDHGRSRREAGRAAAAGSADRAHRRAADERFWTTGDARSATRIIGQLWGRAVNVEHL